MQEENKFFAHVEAKCEEDAIQKARDLVHIYIFKVANYYAESVDESTTVKLREL